MTSGSNGGGGWSYDPNDPEQAFRVLMRDANQYREQLKKNLRMVGLGLLALAAVWLATECFFQLEPEEEAVVLRLGTPLDETFTSGLHTKIPIVDRVYRVPVHRQHRLEFGFRSIPGKVTVQYRNYM